MNKQIANTRIKDVLNVDSINSSQADFLSTHVPFRKIKVTNDLVGNPNSDNISEDSVYDKYFDDSSIYNQHQLIVVDGSSGSGKSHFIRWIAAKLMAKENQKDVVLMIRRSDNTLKGTIKQFLDIDEVKNIKNRDIYERLVKANQNVSESKFKYEIYHKFLVEIADDEESVLSSVNRKNFRELLSSSEFEERMLLAGGPIERIYSKIVDDATGSNEDTLALFEPSDFVMDFEFNERLRDNASKRAQKIANKLLPESDGSFIDEECNPETLANYMNSKVETVISACAGIEPGDFQQIFKEIRQELFSQGKNLILLIEDITSCTGINQDLLNALIVEHTGENEDDQMCRLISVIGTTTEYFKEFRSNYIDRITTKITIEDGAIGNTTDDLIQFVAKYLNILSLTTDDVDEWYKNGALDSEYPVHVSTEEMKWEFYNYNGKELSLYPFSKRAIINLYNDLEQHKTPRYILRRIIEPAVDNIIRDEKHFPTFLKNRSSRLSFDVEGRIKNTLANMDNIDDKEDYRDRVLAIVGFWGDKSLNIKGKSIGTIGSNVFVKFGLQDFAEKIFGKTISGNEIYVEQVDIEDTTMELPESPDSTEKEISKPISNKAFDDFTHIISDWYYEGKNFMKAYSVRDEICKYIFNTISWQREGVSLLSVQMVEKSSYNLISIERQDRAIDKGLVLLEANEETYQLLLAFGKWLHLGNSTWNFENASSSIRVVTMWLEKYKQKFVDIVKAYCAKERYPKYIKASIIAEVYRGLFNGDYNISKLGDLSSDFIIKSDRDRAQKSQSGHSMEWINFMDNIVYSNNKAIDNSDYINRYFNLVQGNVKNPSRFILRSTELEVIFKELKKEKFEISLEQIEPDKIKDRNIPVEYVKKIVQRVGKVLEAENIEACTCNKKLLEYFGFPEGTEIELDDVKDLFNEVIDFYKEIEANSINVISPKTNMAVEFKKRSSEIVKALNNILEDENEMTDIEKLIKYSSNPLKIIKEFIEFLDEVSEDYVKVCTHMRNVKESLTRSGNWSDDVDPRFISPETSIDELIKMMEG